MNNIGISRSSRLLPTRSASNFPDPSATWSDVARLARRVCVLRERGDLAAAEQLRSGPLADLLAPLRANPSDDATIDQRLDAIFEVEQERVANASVLAELLLPLLTDSARPFGAPAIEPSTTPEAPHTVSPSPASTRPPVRRAAGSIADFLDEMIAQEHSEKSDSSHRRAS